MDKNPITIELLETLDAIDRRGSFAKAAEELNKATSALSYAIQKMEEQLGIAVFVRQGRRSVLTPAGRLILTEGRDILQVTSRLVSKAKEVATGWEPRISVAVESLQSYPAFFSAIRAFLEDHPTVELDIMECVLNGGWEALGANRVDLVVGAPGPVPQHRGYRAVKLQSADLIPVIAASHPHAEQAQNHDTLLAVLPRLRRIVTHDTSFADIKRSEGLSSDGDKLYVQNIDQKVQAILAGVGVGHLPRPRIQAYLDSGALLPMDLPGDAAAGNFLAWKINHRGKGLQALTRQMIATFGDG